MKHIYLLSFLFMSVLALHAQSPECISIKGDTISGKFQQVHISNLHPNTGVTNQPEIVSAAWTCSSNGVPSCNFRALIRYDVSAIPANAVINSASLYLYAKPNALNGNPGNPMYGSNNTSLLQKITTPWAYTSATSWNTQPSTTTANQKVLPQSTSTIQNYTVDVTDFVQSWVNEPDSNFGALLRLQTEQAYNSMIFYSGQAPDSLKPKLEICYTVPDSLVVSNMNAKIYPNPFTNGVLKCKVRADKADVATIKLFDQKGLLKKVLATGVRIEPGTNILNLQINRYHLTQGYYYIQIQTPSTNNTTVKLIIL